MLNEEEILKALNTLTPDELFDTIRFVFGDAIFESLDKAYTEIAFREVINPERTDTQLIHRMLAAQWAAFASGWDLRGLTDVGV